MPCGTRQGFTEGNKRTALLLTRWLLDRNGVHGALVLPTDDKEFADILVKSASGLDVENARRRVASEPRSARG